MDRHDHHTVVAIVSVGRHRKDLRLSNAFAGLNLCDDYRDYLPKKRSFRVSSCGRANETLSVNVRTPMTSRSETRKKRSLNLIPNQSQSPSLNQTTRMRSSASFPTLRSRMILLVCPWRVLSPLLRVAC